MPDWGAFQTETGDLIQFKRDFDGEEVILSQFTVDCYFEFGNRRIVTDENEEITAVGTLFVDPNTQFDPNHRQWKFDFEGRMYQVKDINRVKNIGSNTISHFELALL